MEATGKNIVERIFINTLGLKFHCNVKYICSKYLLHIPSLKDKSVRTIKCQSSAAKHFKKMFLKNACSSFGGRKTEATSKNIVKLISSSFQLFLLEIWAYKSLDPTAYYKSERQACENHKMPVLWCKAFQQDV
jgi:hypothetical protein